MGSLLSFHCSHNFCHGWLWDLKTPSDWATPLLNLLDVLDPALQKKFPVRTIFLFCFVSLPWYKIPNLPRAKPVLHNLPKEKEAALPLLAQALEYFSLTCLQETTFQFLPLPEYHLHHSLSDPKFHRWLFLYWNQVTGSQTSLQLWIL